jgi:putative serine protease PepD
MGYAGDEHDEEFLGGSPEGDFPDLGSPDRPRRAIPDPLDRLWMHPSELSPLVGASSTSASRHRPIWTATLVAGAAGAILTLGVLSAVGAIGSSNGSNDQEAAPTTNAVFKSPITTATAVGTGAVLVSVGQSVVAVGVRDASGMRRGSGVCVGRSRGASTANEVITSNRLVGSSVEVTVTTADGVTHLARVVGRDPISDLVLLRLPAPIAAAESAARKPEAGEEVWVIGARPGEDAPWISTGVLAAIDSLVSVDTGPTTSGLLETAAASNAASSGGALVNSAGDVTGIVLSPIGDGRTTYAVPIESALSIAHDLRTHGYAKHGALGIDGVDKPTGPTITGIVSGGPAERAGLQVGDIVESVDERVVDSMDDVMALVRHDSPGDPVAIEIRRGTRRLEMNATLATMGSN